MHSDRHFSILLGQVQPIVAASCIGVGDTKFPFARVFINALSLNTGEQCIARVCERLTFPVMKPPQRAL